MLFKNPAIRYSLLSLVAVIATWELTARFSGWSVQVFPGPGRVFACLIELTANGALLKHSVASLFRVTAGFYLAMLL
ncbi:MAG TPA: hypothetical protein VLA15_04700, partial [Desulfurivibrionaceae bacterium]|nr:hypothetical protein [Desulfurivibrionaceae bacterium]